VKRDSVGGPPPLAPVLMENELALLADALLLGGRRHQGATIVSAVRRGR
jgi:hypothetical protein